MHAQRSTINGQLMHILISLIFALNLGACSVLSSRTTTTRPPPQAQGPNPRPTDLDVATDSWWAQIRGQNYMDCFAHGTTYATGKLAYCEISGVVFDGESVIVANDKPAPEANTSSIFAVDYDGRSARLGKITQWFTAPAIMQGQKFEDLTITPDGKHAIATTAFDRYDAADPSLDGFNRLVTWPIDHPDQAQVIAPVSPSSNPIVALRSQIASALKSAASTTAPNYFKIEGLAAMPDGRLLIGIREMGESFDAFAYQVTLLSVPYAIRNGQVTLVGPFTRVYTQDGLNARAAQPYPLGLSGLAWDPFQGVLWMLTSYEMGTTDEQVGGYLWALSPNDLASQHAPGLVRTQDGQPLQFAHKSEGITVLGPGELLIVHDDDRILGRTQITNPTTQFNRQPEQAAYTFLHVDHIVQ